jgi:hypothetical protein
MSKRGDVFVKDWVSANVQNIPGLDDFQREVERLAATLKADAKAHGIAAAELDETVGDAGDYLANEYEQIHDPESGFKD